jgi:uncharacterized protein (DUF1501 family)
VISGVPSFSPVRLYARDRRVSRSAHELEATEAAKISLGSDMAVTRRVFVQNGALAVVASAALPSFITRAVLGATEAAGANAKRLVVIFQRGAADGLNIVVPHGEASYYAMRPTINIPRTSVLDLDGFFGLHPAMAPLQAIWNHRHLAIIHAVGSPLPTRSHLDAQDFIESGTPGLKGTHDGWLNRAVHATAPCRKAPPLRAVALSPSLPRILSGCQPATAVSNINQFSVSGFSRKPSPVSNTSNFIYEHSIDTVLHGTGQETFEAVKMLKAANPSRYNPAAGADYPQSRFGDSLRHLAQLMKANLGVQVAFADIGGWDHHVNEGNTQGQLANVLRDFSHCLNAFWMDLGSLAEDTVVITLSEFGRTVRENGNGGTDHGHGNAMFVMGGRVKGGKVYGRWPGLDPSQLYERRDLAATTDFRQVLSEAVYGHLGNHNLSSVFPGFDADPAKFLHFLV